MVIEKNCSSSCFQTIFQTFWGFGQFYRPHEVVKFELRLGLKRIVFFRIFAKISFRIFAEITCEIYKNYQKVDLSISMEFGRSSRKQNFANFLPNIKNFRAGAFKIMLGAWLLALAVSCKQIKIYSLRAIQRVFWGFLVLF
jgi:hypothetical protein